MTNKIVLRTVEEFMQDYTPIYQPLYPLFMSLAQAYPTVVGQLDFRRLSAVGDFRAKRITPKDTHIHQVVAIDGKKSFKRYFNAAQYTQSIFQDLEGNEDVIKQVLDENQRLQDEIFMFGEGTQNSDVLNNGLFWSGDVNYVLENSVAVAAGTAADHLLDLHTQIMVTAELANQVAGRKLLLIYGATASAKANGLFSASNASFLATLQESLGANWSIAKVPSDMAIPSSGNGWITCNLDQCKLNFTVLPSVNSQGVNDEEQHTWHNFLSGSMMLECKVKNALIRQPCTFA